MNLEISYFWQPLALFIAVFMVSATLSPSFPADVSGAMGFINEGVYFASLYLALLLVLLLWCQSHFLSAELLGKPRYGSILNFQKIMLQALADIFIALVFALLIDGNLKLFYLGISLIATLMFLVKKTMKSFSAKTSDTGSNPEEGHGCIVSWCLLAALTIWVIGGLVARSIYLDDETAFVTTALVTDNAEMT